MTEGEADTDTDTDSDTDADTDSDTDADTDAGGDTDMDTGSVACGVEPPVIDDAMVDIDDELGLPTIRYHFSDADGALHIHTLNLYYDTVIDGAVEPATADVIFNNNDVTDLLDPCMHFGNPGALGPNQWSTGLLPAGQELELRFSVTDADGLESEPWILTLTTP